MPCESLPKDPFYNSGRVLKRGVVITQACIHTSSWGKYSQGPRLTLWAVLLTYENSCPITDHSGWAPVVQPPHTLFFPNGWSKSSSANPHSPVLVRQRSIYNRTATGKWWGVTTKRKLWRLTCLCERKETAWRPRHIQYTEQISAERLVGIGQCTLAHICPSLPFNK